MRRVVEDPTLASELRRKVVNINPFLRKKCAAGDSLLKKPLDLIDKGQVPNTPEWNNQFGSGPVLIFSKPKAGRWLFGSEED